MGLRGHLLSLRTGVDEGVDLGWGEAFGGPVLLHLVEHVPLAVADLLGEIAQVPHESVMVECNDAMPALGLNPDIGFSYAANPSTREPSAYILAGSDPRSPEGDLARKQAGKRGSLPAMKRFLPRTVFVRVPSFIPLSTSA